MSYRKRARHYAVIAGAVLALAALAAPSLFPAGAATVATGHPRPPLAADPLAQTLAALRARQVAAQQAAETATRREVARQALPPTSVTSYLVSPAVFSFLTTGLGLPLSSPLLAGPVRAGPVTTGQPGDRLSAVAAAPNLRGLLPAAVVAPALRAATLTVDERTGQLSVTATGANARLEVSVPDAGSTTLAGGQGLAGQLSLTAQVLGTPVTLAGSVAATNGRATLSLSGALPVTIPLAGGQVLLEKGDTVSTVTGGGVELSGTAVLGPAGHRLQIAVMGDVSDPRAWTLAATATLGGAPLPGLTLDPAVSGTVTRAHGTVSYDVRGQQAGPWRPVPAATFDGASVEFADRLPMTDTVTAPGIAATTPWVTVTGGLLLADGQQGTLSSTGTVAVNLAAGTAVLSGDQRGSAPLTPPQAPGQSFAVGQPAALSDTGFSGALRLGRGGLTGMVRGTGVVTTLPFTGPAVPAVATVTAGTAPASAPSALFPAGSFPPPSAPPAITAGPPASTLTEGARILPGSPGGAGGSTFTLSAPVDKFLTALGVRLTGPTVTGTLSGRILTVTVPLGQLKLPMPPGITTPSFGLVTIIIDAKARTLSLTANAGQAAIGGPSGTLSVAIADPATASLAGGTGLSATVTLDGLPFAGGATVNLAGTLGYAGGAPTAHLTGQLATPASFDGGAVTIGQGTSVALSAGSAKLTVAGVASVGPPGKSFSVAVRGSVSILSTWSLAVSAVSTASWVPLPGLSLAPAFSGTIDDSAGTVRFTLTAGHAAVPDAGANVLTWQPGGGAAFTLASLEVSNVTPRPGHRCPGVTTGQIWVGMTGTFAYESTGAPGLSLMTSACADLANGYFTISGTDGNARVADFGAGPFAVTLGAVTATRDKQGFTVTGNAALDVSDPRFTVRVTLAFSSGGHVIGAASVRARDAVPSASGSATAILYLSNEAITGFEPKAYLLPGKAFPAGVQLARGVTVAYAGALPASMTSFTTKVPLPSQLQIVASLGTAGFSLDCAASFASNGDPTSGLLVAHSGSGEQAGALYFEDLDLSLKAGPGVTSVSLRGNAYVILPSVLPNQAQSEGLLTASATLHAKSASFTVTLAATNWDNVFFQNLDVQSASLTVGIDGEALPVIKMALRGITLPSQWDQSLGMANDASISFIGDLNPDAPIVAFSITAPGPSPSPSDPVLLPLKAAYLGAGGQPNPNVVNSIAIYQADLYLAPAGGSVNNVVLPPGLTATFAADIAGVQVQVQGAVGIVSPSLDVDVRVQGGGPALGPVTLAGDTHFYLHAHPFNPANLLSFGFTGSFSYANSSFKANLGLMAGDSVADANIQLSIDAGLSSYLQVSGQLSGTVVIGSNGPQFTVSGTGTFFATLPFASAFPGVSFPPETYGTVSFTASFPGSGINWNDTVDRLQDVISFFRNAGGSTQEILAIIRHWGLTTLYDILNALGLGGVTGPEVVSDITTFFGVFSPNFWYLWVQPVWYSLPVVVAVADDSFAAGHRVIDWNQAVPADYDQEWMFVPYTFNGTAVPGYFELVNRNSGQCLSPPPGAVYIQGAALVQEPCQGMAGQLWDLGGPPLPGNWYHGIQNAASGLDLDVLGAQANQGGTIDQYGANGGENQTFWLTSGLN